MTTILLYSLLGCIGMAIRDVSGTFLTVAQNRGHGKVAGSMDVVCDAAQFIMFSFSGEKLMTKGPLGWVGILPILLTGFWSTCIATGKANKAL